MTLISIVIPVYNSHESLDKLHKKIKKFLNVEHEIIFVNDGSKDNSWDTILSISKNHNEVYGINLNKNYGQDNAIMAGLAAAKGDYVVIMDDDLQHDPKYIIDMYAKSKEGFDIVYANFVLKKQKIWKNIGSWINGRIAYFVFDKPKYIYISPFKIINKKIIDEIVKYKSPFVYIDGILLSLTNNIAQIHINHSIRDSGTSNYSFKKSLKVFFNHLLGYSIAPLRIVTVLGIFISLVAALFLIIIIINYFNNKEPEGWTSLMATILFVGGIITFSLGIIGEYIGRLYLFTNNKPQYIVKEKSK